MPSDKDIFLTSEGDDRQVSPLALRCLEFLEREAIASWLGERPAVGIALSGGPDSVALLLVGRELGWRITALHCNFHLRGEESLRDERFVTALCRRLEIPLRTVHFDVPRRQKATGESVEMACRSLRYDWFRRMAADLGLDAIALGHHADDNIETFMLNAMRGSGLRGLRGITPRRDIFIRPLLETSREDITGYLRSRNIDFVTDSTNLQSDFRRNRLRNEVLPPLHRGFPSARSGITSSLRFMREDYRLFDALVGEKKVRYLLPDGSIDIRNLAAEEPCAAPLLYRLLDGRLDRMTVDRILASSGESGRYFRGKDNCSFLLDRGMLRPVDEPERQERHTVKSRRMTRGEFAPRRDPDYAWFDASMLEGDPTFELRDAAPGDRMRPFGMKGTRLLSDIFRDLKLPDTEKWNRKVLTRNGEIIWIPGIRPSALFPVTPRTTNIIELHWEISE